jgi:hypothetical protein
VCGLIRFLRGFSMGEEDLGGWWWLMLFWSWTSKDVDRQRSWSKSGQIKQIKRDVAALSENHGKENEK